MQQSSSYNVAQKPPPPKYTDFSGYGWIIIICGFILYVIVDGIAYNLGLINTVWLAEFKQSETATSWIGSIFYSVPLLSAPITAHLVENFGCKTVTIVCGCISTFGFILSSFSSSIQQLYVTVGLVSGFGVSAAYIVGILSAERWFESHRTLAIGIVSSGTGFGTFVIAPVTQRLLDAYGWRNTMYFFASLNVLMSIVGCFIQDPQWIVDEMRKGTENAELWLKRLSIDDIKANDAEKSSGQHCKVVETAIDNDRLKSIIVVENPVSVSSDSKVTAEKAAKNGKSYETFQIDSEKQEKKAIAVPGFLKDRLKIVKKIFSHFSNRDFSLLALSTFTIYALYNVPMFFIVELLKGYGYTEPQCANYLSIIGISLLVGMVTLGYVGDISGCHVKNVNAVCVLICGIAEAMLPICADNSVAFGVCCVIFGFSFASAYVLIPKIAEMIVGVDEFATAIGLNFFVQGLALLFGIPFASTIYEGTGSWKLAFNICGSIIATGSISAYFINVKNGSLR